MRARFQKGTEVRPTLADAGIGKKPSALPHYEAEARKRQGQGLTAPGKTLGEKIPEAMDSRARDHAAKEFKAPCGRPGRGCGRKDSSSKGE